nr:efflux pump ustt [Quercus suber]
MSNDQSMSLNYDNYGKTAATSTNLQSAPTTTDSDMQTERTPLLQQEPDNVAVQQHALRSSAFVVWIMMLILVLLSFGDQIAQPPVTRIMEAIICYRYYETADPSKIQIGRDAIGPGALGGVPEMLCKTGAVQSELAELGGYQLFLNGLPALILAVPFGWVADQYGRKPVFALSVLSINLAFVWPLIVLWFFQLFAIRLVWLSTLFCLLGGGSTVCAGLLYVIVSDVTTPMDRTAVFLRLSAVNLFAGLAMPPIAAWLMVYNPWIPVMLGTLLQLVSLALVFFLPETLNHKLPSFEGEDESTRLATEVQPVPSDIVAGGTPTLTYASRMILLARQSTVFLTEDWRVLVCLIPFVGHLLIGQIGGLLLQYCSSRYSLTFSNATLLLTIFSGIKVLLLAIILPYVSQVTTRYFHLTGQQNDFYLTRASLVFVVVGWTLIGLAPTIPIVILGMIAASLGYGALILIRSFVTTLVPAHHIARLYSVITIVDTLGSMFGAALLADLFQQGLKVGGIWIGAPFFFVGLMSLTFLILMMIVRLRQDEVEASIEGEHAREHGDEREMIT